MHSDSMSPLRQRGYACYAATPSASSRFSVRFWGRRRRSADQILDAYETFAHAAETHALKVIIEA